MKRLLLGIALTGMFWLGSIAQTTLNPTADTDSQSDVAAGTNPQINFSQWCEAYFRFDCSSVSGTVSAAHFKVYSIGNTGSWTVVLKSTSTDTWSEGGTKPTAGTQIITIPYNGSAGYMDFDITSFVQSKMSGNKIVSVTVTTSGGEPGWTGLYARQNSTNKPQLIITTASVAVTGVSLSPTSATINIGSTQQLTATVAPANATNKTVSWKSSNTAVATVSSSGLITAVASGSATITVTTQDGSKTATCAVTVPAPGGTSTLNPTADTDSQSDIAAGTNPQINFSQWCEAYFRFDCSSVSGTVSAAHFKVYSIGNTGSWTVVLKSTSTDTWSEGGTKPTAGTQITTIPYNGAAGYMDFDITSFVQSKMSGSKIVSVTVTTSGGEPGWTGLYARQNSTNKPQLVVTTSGGGTVAVTGVTVSPTTASISVGGTTTLTATVAPSNATNKTVSWSSSNTGIATVNSSGVVTGVAAGSATITVTTQDGAKTATCAVTVASSNVAVTGVSVSPTTASINVGATTALTATVAPSNATNKTVSWTSSNTSVANVNSSGVVTGVAAGSATITVTTQDGGKTATCAVTVTSTPPPPAGVMTPGTQFWRIDWEGWQDFFASGVNWTTTTNPWNPTFVAELQQAKMKTLRFMDWNVTNDACISDWSQRIPKTANHYNVGNTVSCYQHNYDGATNTHSIVLNGATAYGVAYEWQIDLCNRIGADYWINIPMNATDDYCYQLATLIKNQLGSNQKIYIEWANETWNYSFSTWVYADQHAKALGLPNTYTINGTTYYGTDCRAYNAYASVRAFAQFERVFGTNSPRLVKVIAGQIGTYWNGHNNMVGPDLAALKNTTINPAGITANAWAGAPYIGGQTMTEESNRIAVDVTTYMGAAYNDLAGSGLNLICYEGGADNYPDNNPNLALTRDAQQEQIYVNYLTELAKYVQGPFNQYCFYGGCWGLKYAAGESYTINPKWRGWQDYWGGTKSAQVANSINGGTQDLTSIGLSLYPNPASDMVNIKLPEPGEAAIIELLDITGKKLLTKSVLPGTGISQFATSAYSNGIYVLNLKQGNRSYMAKVIIKK